MNQILLTNYDKSSRNNKNSGNADDLKKIIIFFAITILIFGVAIGGIYLYKIIKKDNKKETIAKPEIIIEETEDNKVKIIVNSEAGISKVIYSWDEEEEQVEERSGSSYEKMIDIPYDVTTLQVRAIDITGQETQTTKTIENNEQQNSNKITINISVVENENSKSLKIVAESSEAPIKYIEYKWNEEEENRITPEDEQVSFETTIDVKRGLNTITITAEDIEGNINSINQNFEGKLKPEIKVYKQDDRIYMKVSHYKGLKEIQYLINGNELIYDENYSEYDSEKTEVEFSFKLQEGENTVIIKATSNEDTQEEYSGSKTYHEQ